MWELRKCENGVITLEKHPDATAANKAIQELEKQGFQYVDRLNENANHCYEIKFRREVAV